MSCIQLQCIRLRLLLRIVRSLLCWNCGSVDIRQSAIVRSPGWAGKKDHRQDTQNAKYGDEQPCALFEYVSCLFDTHKLIVKPRKCTTKATSLGVLYQNDQSQNDAHNRDEYKYYKSHCYAFKSPIFAAK